jgi:FAD/FMN-containing dehydrogenase
MPMTKISAPSGFRGTFRVDEPARAVYSEAAGIARVMPRAVAVPVDGDDLAVLISWAAAHATPLIPRGSGSSMPGGAIGDGVIVDVSRWRAMGDVNETSKCIRVQPGVLRGEVEARARAHGLRFPVDPSSGAFCTIGGMASTNAAGSHSMHFGSMRSWVNGLSCLFADGTRADLRRGTGSPRGVPAIDRFLELAHVLDSDCHPGVLKDSSGYGIAEYRRTGELVDLLVGSEGTLAVFCAIELRLIDAPAATSSVLGAFASLEQAVEAALRARASGAVACELLDRTFLDVAASGGGERQVPADTESALLAEVEGGDGAEAADRARTVERIFREAGATEARIALDKPTETELWELRHAASPILARLDPNLRSMQFIEDCAVPPANLPAYVRGVRHTLAENHTRGVIFGHAGDAHVHVNPLIDLSLPDWRERVERILDSVVSLSASLGGTLTGEHGDGRLRTPFLSRVWPAGAIDDFASIKRAFDPKGILNPGVKVGRSEDQAVARLGDIKYDPSLPPLPDSARAALNVVERDRAYSRFRLDLLDEAR